MKKPKDASNWFFLDESGDPNFYKRKKWIVGQPGCSPIFILGFIETQDPSHIRRQLAVLRDEIRNHPTFQNIHTLKRSLTAFHAKDDHHRIRDQVFDVLPALDFRAQLIVIRKSNLEHEFNSRFCGDGNRLYDQVVSMLFRDVLHRHTHNHIYYSTRGNRIRQIPVRDAIYYAAQEYTDRFGRPLQCTLNIQPQTPSGEPCLSVIDYVTWAVYRMYVQQDDRYLRIVQDKISLILDRYHPNGIKRYTRNEPLTLDNLYPIEKATLL